MIMPITLRRAAYYASADGQCLLYSRDGERCHELQPGLATRVKMTLIYICAPPDGARDDCRAEPR